MIYPVIRVYAAFTWPAIRLRRLEYTDSSHDENLCLRLSARM